MFVHYDHLNPPLRLFGVYQIYLTTRLFSLLDFSPLMSQQSAWWFTAPLFFYNVYVILYFVLFFVAT